MPCTREGLISIGLLFGGKSLMRSCRKGWMRQSKWPSTTTYRGDATGWRLSRQEQVMTWTSSRPLSRALIEWEILVKPVLKYVKCPLSRVPEDDLSGYCRVSVKGRSTGPGHGEPAPLPKAHLKNHHEMLGWL